MRILGIYTESSACDYHRVRLPLENLTWQDGDSIRLVEINDLTAEDLDTDIIYYNRVPPIGKSQLADLKRKGVKIVCDIDDYWELPEDHHMYEHFTKHGGREVWLDNIRNADLVTCTNSNLWKEIVGENINSVCEVIPNALPYGLGQFRISVMPREVPEIIYAGGPSHVPDLKIIHGVFKELSEDPEFKELFHLAGYLPGDPISETMLAMFGRNNVKLSRMLPVDKYMELYDFSTLSLAPLRRDNFNRMKSNLKILEAGAKKIPILCSSIDTYTDDVLCHGVKICHDDRDWIRWIKRFSESKAAREDAGEELHAYCKEKYDLLKVNKLRYDILKDLIT